jgi:hypothetical protein
VLLYLKSICQKMTTIDKSEVKDDNRSMNLTASEVYRIKQTAMDKDAQAIIARDFSASRMNATKWREVIEELEEIPCLYRLRWVDVPDVSLWMGLWIPFLNSTYFDSAVGQFRTFTIEWLEIDPVEEVSQGLLLKTQHIHHTVEIERRLQAINVPYEWSEGYIRIVGYIRSG